MTGAGLPPIALEAVLKLLAIGQDSAKARKAAKAADKPNLRLELTPAAAQPFTLPLRAAAPRAASRTAQRRQPTPRKSPDPRPTAEGAESC